MQRPRLPETDDLHVMLYICYPCWDPHFHSVYCIHKSVFMISLLLPCHHLWPFLLFRIQLLWVTKSTNRHFCQNQSKHSEGWPIYRLPSVVSVNRLKDEVRKKCLVAPVCNILIVTSPVKVCNVSFKCLTHLNDIVATFINRFKSFGILHNQISLFYLIIVLNLCFKCFNICLTDVCTASKTEAVRSWFVLFSHLVPVSLLRELSYCAALSMPMARSEHSNRG